MSAAKLPRQSSSPKESLKNKTLVEGSERDLRAEQHSVSAGVQERQVGQMEGIKSKYVSKERSVGGEKAGQVMAGKENNAAMEEAEFKEVAVKSPNLGARPKTSLKPPSPSLSDFSPGEIFYSGDLLCKLY